MITYKDEDLKYVFGPKEKFLNDFVDEEHKNIQVFRFDERYDPVCPVCASEEYVEHTQGDDKTYFYCEYCETLIARYLDHNECRYLKLINAGEAE